MIRVYAQSERGRARGFDSCGYEVFVPGRGDVSDDEHAAFTESLLGAANLAEANRALLRDLELARAQIEALTARNKEPRRPVRLLGQGCVRWDERGLWLLNTQAKGWSAWGIQLDDWDALFRGFNVRVTKVGEDEHGPYALVEPGGLPDGKEA